MTSTLIQDLAAQLDARARDHLLRRRRPVATWHGVEAVVDGRTMVCFCTNDYLGFAHEPAIAEAAARAARDWGSGAAASRLIAGDYGLIRLLEDRLAAWKGAEAALVFPSGYMANLAAVSALCGKDDTVVLDKLAHASLVDGARLARARIRVFPHNDVGRLEDILRARTAGRVLVATESVFSMDGDTAPLAAIADVCDRHGAALLVDEAHALGVYGEGRGCVAAAGIAGRVAVTVGTLSKALGSQGGFVAGARPLVEHLVNTARPFIYSTGLAPASAGAALAALDELEAGSSRVTRLWTNVGRLRGLIKGVAVPGDGPICPVVTGSAASAMTLAGLLGDAGFLAPAVRPPTVPRNRARVRVTVSAAHAAAQIDTFAQALHAALAQMMQQGTTYD